MQAQEIEVLPTWLDNLLRESCQHVQAATARKGSVERNRTRTTTNALHKIRQKLISEEYVLTLSVFNEVERRLLKAGCWSQWPLHLAMFKKIDKELQELQREIR